MSEQVVLQPGSQLPASVEHVHLGSGVGVGEGVGVGLLGRVPLYNPRWVYWTGGSRGSGPDAADAGVAAQYQQLGAGPQDIEALTAFAGGRGKPLERWCRPMLPAGRLHESMLGNPPADGVEQRRPAACTPVASRLLDA